MKILIIGGKGTIGKKVSDHFSKKHVILIGGRNSGDIIVDIANSKSIEAMFESVGNVDAVVCIAGEAKWAAFDSMTEEDFYIGLKSKLMGQVNLVRIGQNYLNGGINHKRCYGKWWNSQFCQSGILRVEKWDQN